MWATSQRTAVWKEFMKCISLAIFALAMILPAPCASGVQQEPDAKASCAFILQALHDASELHPGMTRSDAERYFQLQEAGLQSRRGSFYVYRKCPYLKIKIYFELDPNVDEEFSPHDRITKSSTMYVESEIFD